jgi:hypothetical protein
MREQTLRHLILLTGKSLSENDENGEFSLRIEKVCRTLTISREKRSPYLLKWQENDLEREISIDDDQFSFHVRGDVPNRNPNNEDMRSKNWNAACLVWSRILGVSIQSAPAKLAPQFLLEASRPKVIKTIRLAFGLIACVTAFLFDQETGIAILGILACNETLKFGDSAVHRTTGLVLFGVTTVVATAVSTSGALSFLGIVLLELITAFFVFTYREVLILLLATIPTLLISVFSSEMTLSWGASRLLGFLVLVSLSVLTLPFGRSGNLRRISVPFGLALCFLCGNLNSGALWASMLFVLMCLNPIEIRRPKLFIKNENSTVTRVSIRQSRGL